MVASLTHLPQSYTQMAWTIVDAKEIGLEATEDAVERLTLRCFKNERFMSHPPRM